MPALLHVAAQAARERARHPAHAAREQHRLAVARARRVRQREVEVAREVVADAVAVEVAQQRRDLAGEPGGPAVLAGEHARPAHAAPARAVERVGHAVAQRRVVDRVRAEPGDRGHHDEHRRALARLHQERHLGAIAAGLQLDEVEPALAARGAQLQRPLRARGHLPAPYRPLAADAADRPAIGARARVDEEVGLLARGHRPQRRLGGERAHGDAGRAGRGAGIERHARGVGADVAGAVAHPHLDDVDAGRHRLPSRHPVPEPPLEAGLAAAPGHELRLRRVGADHAEARAGAGRDAGHEDPHLGRLRPDHLARPDAHHARGGRRRVERDQPRIDDRAALLEQGPADPVDAVGRDRAVVRAAVPGDADRARGADRPLREQPPDRCAGLVDQVGGQHVGLAHAQLQLGAVTAAVAVGREPALALQLHDGRRALEPLGDEEGAEGRRHEGEEDDAGECGHERPVGAAGARREGAATSPTEPCPGRGSRRRRRPR